jgi:hypothetical protein
MAASVDDPMLNDHRSGLVPGHRPGMWVRSGYSVRQSAAAASSRRPDMTGWVGPEGPPGVVQFRIIAALSSSRFQRIYGTEFGTQLKRIWRDQW